MKINVHAGHGKSGGLGSGAVGVNSLDESREARKVKDLVIKYLRSMGHTVYDCAYEGNASANTILGEIVKKCNAHTVDLDVSIHLNAARNDYKGDGDTGGTIVFGYDNNTETVGSRIAENISKALNVRNRGFMVNKDLYVLKKTKAQAILIECIFLDDKDDVDRWNVDKCAKAIAEGITNDKAVINKTASTVKMVNVPSYKKGSIDYGLVFDAEYYMNKYADVRIAFGNNAGALFNHFWLYGMDNGRQGNANFDVNVYKNTYADLREAFGNDLTKYYKHYCQYGYKEGRITK